VSQRGEHSHPVTERLILVRRSNEFVWAADSTAPEPISKSVLPGSAGNLTMRSQLLVERWLVKITVGLRLVVQSANQSLCRI